MQAAALAAHRFGFSETSLQVVGSDPRGWVMAQLRRPSAFDAQGLLASAEAGPLTRRVLRSTLTPAAADAASRAAMADASPTQSGGEAERRRLRRANELALQRRWQHIVTTPTPVFERWVMFWANHFCVAATKGATLAMVWPHEREAIRPHATGRFADLLRAATLHAAMLLYLDNAQSIGPASRAGRRRERGLNENLARELLELHTLGTGGGYAQADVTELATLLTGWTVTHGDTTEAVFRPALHEPGGKRVLGRLYREGPEAVDALFDELARHPSTARFIAVKLVRHFVSDEPPAALIDAVAARFRASEGDLLAVAEALFGHDLAWRANTPPKFKRPEELLLSAHRMLKLPVVRAPAFGAALAQMGQPPGRAPSPQGWPDRSEDWLAPDALLKRVEWTSAFATEHAGLADARQLAELAFGPALSGTTRQQIGRADNGAQALALLLASPEFQRR